MKNFPLFAGLSHKSYCGLLSKLYLMSNCEIDNITYDNFRDDLLIQSYLMST